MSQENVEIVRRALDAWNAGDMDEVRAAYDADVILRTPEGWPEPGPYVGREAVMCQFEQNRQTWTLKDGSYGDVFEPITDFLPVADRVIVRMIWHGAGPGADAKIEFTHVFTMRKGRVFHQEFFWSHDDAPKPPGCRSRREVALRTKAAKPLCMESGQMTWASTRAVG